MKKITIGILAHVDAGKTTLSEGLLYKTGAIRQLGRVDHGNAFLDTDAQERARGITIFSKQALLSYKNTQFMLLDTPGHVDFSAEMERTLQVLDYAVLVISGKDGVQGHTSTLWKLLAKYDVPVFIFINKMDLDGAVREDILEELRRRLDQRLVDFSDDFRSSADEWMETAAMCDEALLDEFLESGQLSSDSLRGAIMQRALFPCFFGSALKMEGIDSLLDGLDEFTCGTSYGDAFGARVYKITRDDKGSRLTHMKVTGGTLKTKEEIVTGSDSSDKEMSEKVEQIRMYSGTKFSAVDSAAAGDVIAVTGLKDTYAGQGLGIEADALTPTLESVLTYQVILPPNVDTHTALIRLKQLEEEDPQLRVIWNEQLQEIQMQLMGEVQTEILKNVIFDRFGMDIEFGQGNITYKETIKSAVIGRGHFEPLRHFAEVHILLEPGEPGSGLTYDSVCNGDELPLHWQKLIHTHFTEKEHIGVLTGSPITDMKLTILAGKSHLKHTVPGDFRQATYRAIRQGLMKTESVLLEPWYEFRLEIPSDCVGRAMSDIQKMSGSFDDPQPLGDMTMLTGKAPVSEMKDYALEVVSYTKGHGILTCALAGYEPCHDQDRVIAEYDYDPEADLENTPDSVFCSHGAGHTVKWDEADEMMHVVSRMPEEGDGENPVHREGGAEISGGVHASYRGTKEEDAELDRIFEMTYGKPKERRHIPKREILSEREKVKIMPTEVKEEFLLVDGYNIIFAWDQLKELAKVSIDGAREALIEILANYQGYKKCRVIVVFDAYRVKGGERHFEKHENVDVVYTAEAETADMYIEKTAHEKAKDYLVRVATSDRLEQMIIVGSGAFKVSADEFRLEVEQADLEISRMIEELNRRNKLENRRGIVIPGKEN
ncbi:MAG: TetM/TetW/TetO/TetS family tetracycline resistance ribosomal protection protein [Firmicutes bacterium]|nr:TetM/TetW/TetO/TetS family tetracycline resistance ribosomal protection protein [Bacillota bacterium]